MSEKITLSEREVLGNLQEYTQIYNIYYYPKEQELKDNIALCMRLEGNKDGKKHYARRTLRFVSDIQLKSLIKDLIAAYFYIKEKRNGEIQMAISQYRTMCMMPDLLSELSQAQREAWRKQ